MGEKRVNKQILEEFIKWLKKPEQETITYVWNLDEEDIDRFLNEEYFV